jgi:hypothetical protein
MIQILPFGITALNQFQFPFSFPNIKNQVVWKEQAVLVVGAASSRDLFNSRLEAAPTDVFFSYLDLPDKRIK